MTANRYHRQVLLPQIGPHGQARLHDASVLLVGCGALGTVIADQLARAGVGRLRLVDRDIVEPSNLQRQTLFDEADARDGAPKAIAAAHRLAAINSATVLEPHILDINPANIASLADGIDLILDGTDNVAIRYLINDLSIQRNIPWIYGAAVGTEGRMLPVDPTRTPCLRCLFPTPPNPTDLPTCDTAGVLGMVPAIVGSLQAAAALKILTRHPDAAFGWLYTLDLWDNRLRVTDARAARREDCLCCAQRQFQFLHQPHAQSTATLCGRNAVQVVPSHPNPLDLPQLADRLAPLGNVSHTPHLVRFTLPDSDITLTIFHDARAIIQNTNDPARARSLYARYIGQ